MNITLGYVLVFLLTAYSFAFGCEFGYKQYQKEIAPRYVIEPRFRVVWRNPRIPDRKLSK